MTIGAADVSILAARGESNSDARKTLASTHKNIKKGKDRLEMEIRKCIYGSPDEAGRRYEF